MGSSNFRGNIYDIILWILMDKLPAILGQLETLTREMASLKNPAIDLTKGAAILWMLKKQN